jgi:cellulose synthase/poly-beta-1,6-N-acetylglucosamine synthase-like glycosyltransferase
MTTMAILLAVPVTVVSLEIIVAIVLPQRQLHGGQINRFRGRVAVLVPAHNECTAVLQTLEEVKAQLRPGDRLVIIADNCTDNTASIAAAASADVVERNDPPRIGKGYALDFGIHHLRADPPDVVIIIDADCRLAHGVIDQLATSCAIVQRPVQGLNLMTAPKESSINLQIREFAWRVKNWVRPLGLHGLKLPCQLMGTGMAFPWGLIRDADLAGGSIVEDLKLGIDLTMAGYSAQFCPSARIYSQFSSSPESGRVQQRRWEEGHIRLILTTGPRMIYLAVRHGDVRLLALALDLVVPPLSLLVVLICAMLGITGLSAILGLTFAPLIISAASLWALFVAIFLSWLTFGRDVLTATALLCIPYYVSRKLHLYWQILTSRRTARWTRTHR